MLCGASCDRNLAMASKWVAEEFVPKMIGPGTATSPAPALRHCGTRARVHRSQWNARARIDRITESGLEGGLVGSEGRHGPGRRVREFLSSEETLLSIFSGFTLPARRGPLRALHLGGVSPTRCQEVPVFRCFLGVPERRRCSSRCSNEIAMHRP